MYDTIETMSPKILLPICAVGASIGLLIAMALQYPFSVTFPIGPDAPAHIRDALKITKEYPGDSKGVSILTHSPYPLSILLFNTTRILPISWAERFTWWIAMGHIAVGLSLGLFIYRIHSWQAAAIAMSIWAPLTMVFNNHFASGTLPQLWSLAFLLLFLERFAARSVIWSSVLLLIVLFSHPITAILLTLAFLVVLPSYWLNWKHLDARERRLVQVITYILTVILAYIAYTYILRGPIHIFWDGAHLEFQKLITSEIAPWILLSIPGWIIVQRVSSMRPMTLALWNTLYFLTLVLAINEQFGVDIWTYRFRSTVAIMVIGGISIGLLEITRYAFQNKFIRGSFITLLLTSIALFSWSTNAAAYALHEKKFNHGEITAMQWMQTLPSNSIIASTNIDRVSEWVPIYSKHLYQELNPEDKLFSLHGDELAAYVASVPYTHVIFLLRRESVPENFIANPNVFTQIYSKDKVTIFTINK